MSAPECGVRTPGSCRPHRRVVVLGAGIAGLTAAHELVERGFDVTVYEPLRDERAGFPDPAAGPYPPVKLGGLAASQFAAVGPEAGEPGRLRPFPGRRGVPRPPGRLVAGEHGFRFFPAYYLHLWDLLQRIPIYEPVPTERGWRPTSRTVMDNVRRMVTQATTVDGKPSLVIPREAPRSLAELVTVGQQLVEFGFTQADVSAFTGRLLRYLTTSPLRRAAELTDISIYDYFTGRTPGGPPTVHYTPAFDAVIRDMPKVLAAFHSRWGDARTNLTTYLQLYLQMDRRDNKADGVLNGSTTETWFDHWYRHLTTLGVRFRPGAAARIEPPTPEPGRPPHRRPKVRVVLSDGTTLDPDYVVLAVDAPAAERVTAALRAAGTGGAVAGLGGFSSTVAPPGGPLQPEATRPARGRDPFSMDDMGRVPWDRFQTLAGIQFYFDTEFQLVRGHVYYSGTEWGLSSINQQAMWECRPMLARDGFGAMLSVDIGDFNSPSRHLLDEHGEGKAARSCTADELAVEVWRQITTALSGATTGTRSETLFPTPAWYALDRNLVFDGPPGEGAPVRNAAPYLVPIVGDWPNRPAGEPWNPAGSSWITRPTEDQWLEDLDRRHVWQARHGGYPVHHNSLVVAGTWTRTFTRMTTMEGACESGRHAVNAILDHYIWTETCGADRREHTTLYWRVPFGFLDQGFSIPIRLPSPAGDYCFVFDIENREPLETRSLRDLDTAYFLAGLPHPFDTVTAGPTGGPPMTGPNDYTGNLLAYLQAWRQYLEEVAAGRVAGYPVPPWPAPPPAPPPASSPASSPTAPDPAGGPAGPGPATPAGPPNVTTAPSTYPPGHAPGQPPGAWPHELPFTLPFPLVPGWPAGLAGPPGMAPRAPLAPPAPAPPAPAPPAPAPGADPSAGSRTRTEADRRGGRERCPAEPTRVSPDDPAPEVASAFLAAGGRTVSSSDPPPPIGSLYSGSYPGPSYPGPSYPGSSYPGPGAAADPVEGPPPARPADDRRRAAQRYELLTPPNPRLGR